MAEIDPCLEVDHKWATYEKLANDFLEFLEQNVHESLLSVVHNDPFEGHNRIPIVIRNLLEYANNNAPDLYELASTSRYKCKHDFISMIQAWLEHTDAFDLFCEEYQGKGRTKLKNRFKGGLGDEEN